MDGNLWSSSRSPLELAVIAMLRYDYLSIGNKNKKYVSIIILSR